MNKHKIAAAAFTPLLLALGLVVITPTLASAHDAPPTGQATCTNGTWKVTGTATLQDVPSADSGKTTVTITSTAGTVSQTPGSAVGQSNGTHYTYTNSGIPASVASVTITASTSWPGHHNGDVRTAKVNRPSSGCAVTSDASASVSVTSPTCDHPSNAVFTAEHAAANGPVNQTTGTHSVTFTADIGHTFPGGASTKTVTYTILDRLAGQQCATKPPVKNITKVTDSCQIGGFNRYTGTEDYTWNGTAYVLDASTIQWNAPTFTSYTPSQAVAKGCTKAVSPPKHTRPRVTIIDRCSCSHDSVTVRVAHATYHLRQTSRTSWRATFYAAPGYVIKAQHSNTYAPSEVYTWHTSAKPCACTLHHTCHKKHKKAHHKKHHKHHAPKPKCGCKIG